MLLDSGRRLAGRLHFFPDRLSPVRGFPVRAIKSQQVPRQCASQVVAVLCIPIPKTRVETGHSVTPSISERLVYSPQADLSKIGDCGFRIWCTVSNWSSCVTPAQHGGTP